MLTLDKLLKISPIASELQMIDVVFLPSLLRPQHITGARVVVLDVLRATSTMVTALAHGATAIHYVAEPAAALAQKAALPGALACGERDCLKVPGFDLGNSPAEFIPAVVQGKTLICSTTNGTRALLAAHGASEILLGSLLNAQATAQWLSRDVFGAPITLLCAGTQGAHAIEDVIGAGAILWNLLQQTYRPDLPFTDTAWMAYHTFAATRSRLPAALRLGQGGINLISAGLETDIDRCAELDSQPLVAKVDSATQTIRQMFVPLT